MTALVSTTPIFTISAELEAITDFGLTPYGGRRVIAGGCVCGLKLNGRIVPDGADWQIIRADGAAHIQARCSIETDSGGLILAASDGPRHGPTDVLAAPARSELVDPAADWLNRILAIARGQREACAARLDVFKVE